MHKDLRDSGLLVKAVLCTRVMITERLQVDGRSTQGENIADNGGLKQSFRVRLSALILLCSFID